MEASIVAYRGSYKTQHSKQMIIKPVGVDTKEDAQKLAGRTATWTSPSGKEISGRISAPHGGKGYVRVVFEDKGLPGQALGTKIQIK